MGECNQTRLSVLTMSCHSHNIHHILIYLASVFPAKGLPAFWGLQFGHSILKAHVYYFPVPHLLKRNNTCPSERLNW